MRSKINQNVWAIAGFAIVLLIQCIVPSQFNGFESPFQSGFHRLIENDYAKILLIGREVQVSFYHRIVFRSMHRFLVEVGLPIQFSFTLLSCFFIICNYFLLVLISKQLCPSRSNNKYLAIGYFGLFTILFGYLGGMFTYEEPAQYFFLLLTFWCVLNEMVLFAAGFFFISLLAKETSVLFFPVWIYLNWKSHWVKRLIIALSAALIIYVLYHQFWIPDDLGKQLIDFTMGKRFYAWEKNFANIQKTSETLFDAFLVLGIPLLLVFKYKIEIKKLLMQRVYHSFIFLCMFNTLLIFFAAIASEARLFALPLLLFLPLLPAFIPKITFHKPKILSFLVALAIASPTILFLYKTSMVGTGYIYKCYAILYLAGFIGILQKQKIPLGKNHRDHSYEERI